MRHVFVMDPIERVQIHKDSTFALMVEAQRRGHELFLVLESDLYLRRDATRAPVRAATLRLEQGRHAALGEPRDVDLATHDVVWMRKDPPFHMGYVFNTYLLDHVARRTLVVNHPAGLRDMNEKAWALRYPDLVPESVVTQSTDRIRAYAEELGAIVVKPLDGNGGAGVFLLRADDPNIGVIIDMSTAGGARKVLAQRFVPEARLGDKRIILVEGEAVGAVNRVPTGVDHRGNISVGARVERATLTERDRAICSTIGPALRDAGQVFVGIDVIGEFLTEVNVTSPTGIHEINALDGVHLEALILDAVEARRARA